MLIASTALRSCERPGCGQSFQPRTTFQCWCSPKCGAAIAKARVKADRQRVNTEAKQSRQVDRAKREALKTLPELHREAQREFNRYIRLRDHGRPCICCGRPLEDRALTGGGYDAGHYRSVGSAPQLRYREDNVHAQRKVCNQFGAGRAVDYRIGLIARIGVDAVEALERENSAHKWERDEVRAIRDTYRAKANALAKTLKE